jgi:hypothetical protein
MADWQSVIKGTPLAKLKFVDKSKPTAADKMKDPMLVMREKFSNACAEQRAIFTADQNGQEYKAQRKVYKDGHATIKDKRISRWWWPYAGKWQLEPKYGSRPLFPAAIEVEDQEQIPDVLTMLAESAQNGDLDDLLVQFKRTDASRPVGRRKKA